MKATTLSLCMIFVMNLLTGEASLVFAQQDMGQATESEQEAGPVEFEQVIEFDRDIHFQTPDGQDTVVPAGGYYVDAVENGLRLKSADKEEAETIIVHAEMMTHDQSVEAPEVLSMKEGDDQQVVMVLLPDGKAMQAVGSSSGVSSRHSPPKIQPGFLKGLAGKLPTIQSLLATPPPPSYALPPAGNISPLGTLYIKGEKFETSKGKVTLQVQVPVDKHFYVPAGVVSLPGSKSGTRRIQLEVQQWSPNKIIAKMPLVSGVPDHSATLQILDSKGLGSLGWKVPFYATRARTTLQLGENLTSHKCISPNDDKGGCLDQPYANPIGLNADCFTTAKLHKDKTLTAYHVNCDQIIDWDKGTDQYTIELKNNWVIEEMRWGFHPHSTSEKLKLASAAAMTQYYKGASKLTLYVPWEVSPGPDWLSYWIDIDIKGPAGVLYGDRVYWKN